MPHKRDSIEQEIKRFEEMKSYFSIDFETGRIIRTKTTGKKADILSRLKAVRF